MAPVLDEVARLRADVCMVKVDTAHGAAVARRLGIRSIPTLVLLPRGREVARQSGAVPLPQLVAWLERHAVPHTQREAS